MMEVLKEKLNDMCGKWIKEIEASKDSQTIIDIG